MNELVQEADRLEELGSPLCALIRWHRQAIAYEYSPQLMPSDWYRYHSAGDGTGGGRGADWLGDGTGRCPSFVTLEPRAGPFGESLKLVSGDGAHPSLLDHGDGQGTSILDGDGEGIGDTTFEEDEDDPYLD